MKVAEYGRELLGISLAFLIAARKVGAPIGLQKALFTLYTKPEPPWTLSALSEETRRDRATIRNHFNGLPKGSIRRDGDYFILTEDGRVEYLKMIIRFCRSLEQPHLAALSELYRGEQDRILLICGLACTWDNMAENTGFSKTLLACFMAVYLRSGSGGISTAEISKWTTFSYQGVHRGVTELEQEGSIKKVNRKWISTLKGDLKAVEIIVKGIAASDVKELKTIAKLVLLSKATR